MWRRLSKVWAEGTDDVAHFFKGENFNPQGIWNTVEKEVLEKNGVKIIEH